jgi:protein PhnA
MTNSSDLPSCPKCISSFVYSDQDLLICPECAHEWNPSEDFTDKSAEAEDLLVIKDINGTPLAEGDKVMLIKDLKVKGSSTVLKIGTKAIIRRLLEGDHDLDCRVDGHGEMMLRSLFVRQAN